MIKRLFPVLVVLILLLVASVAAAAPRLAIGTLGLAPDQRDGMLADLVASDLSAIPELELVERRELDTVLKEVSLGFGGLVRAKEAVQVGALVRADLFLLGSSLRLQGTNCLVIRLVDARTGSMRDIRVFRDTGALDTLAQDIAQFVRSASQNPPQGARDYLAIGVIQNLGVNNRFADFPAQMRGYLAANLGARVTVLERDVVSFLANEVRLDLAGLTQTNAGTAPQLQFGFWIVDGFYQSYEVAEPEVQLRLRVERVLGGRTNYTLLGKPEEAFLKQISESVTRTLDHPAELLGASAPTREGELQALQARAQQLVDYAFPVAAMPLPARVRLRVAKTGDKMLNTLEEATRVYDSMVLLAPDNVEAKMLLATCLLLDLTSWGGPVRQIPEPAVTRARECYREVIAAADPVYSADAAVSLAFSYGGLRGVDLLRSYTPNAPTPKGRKMVRTFAFEMVRNLVYRAPTESLLPYLRGELVDALQAVEANTNASVRIDFEPVLFSFHPRDAESVINALLPDLVAGFPDLEPYLLLEAAGEQLNPDSPVTARFLSSLKQCEAHPERVRQAQAYFTHLSSTLEEEAHVGVRGTLLQRMFEHHAYVTLTNAVLTRQRAAEKGLAPPLTPTGKRVLADTYRALQQWKEALALYMELPEVPPQAKNECRKHLGLASESEELPESAWKDETERRKVELAYRCMGREQWRTALVILESLGHRTVAMSGGGPWARGLGPALPPVAADECRAKAGLPPVTDPMRFELGERPFVHFARDGLMHLFSFQVEGDDVWVASGRTLERVHGTGFAQGPEVVETHQLPRTTDSCNTCVCVSPDYIWIGTEDDGLVELNRHTGACRRFTTKDGLPVNGVYSLYLQGHTLWLAYWHMPSGLVGTLDLTMHKFSTFTPALSARAGMDSQPDYYQDRLDQPTQPPQHPVTALLEGDPGEMWFAVREKGLQRFWAEDHTWATLGSRPYVRPNAASPQPIPIDLLRQPWLRQIRRPEIAVAALAADPAHGLLLAAVRDYSRDDGGGLLLFDYRQNQAQWLSAQNGWPSGSLTAVAVDDRMAWVGGYGFVALLDVPTRKVVRIAYVATACVQRIQLDKRYAWIQVSCGEDRFSPEYGSAWNGVYRLERATVEPKP